MVGIAPPEDVLRVLDHRMLKAAAGAKKRDASLSGMSNGEQGAVHAAIRDCPARTTSPSHPERTRNGIDLVGRNPSAADGRVRARAQPSAVRLESRDALARSRLRSPTRPTMMCLCIGCCRLASAITIELRQLSIHEIRGAAEYCARPAQDSRRRRCRWRVTSTVTKIAGSERACSPRDSSMRRRFQRLRR